MRNYLKIFLGVVVLIAFYSVLAISTSNAQFIEKKIGLPCEDRGYFSMPSAISYDQLRNRLAVSDKARGLIYIFDLTDMSSDIIGQNIQIKEPVGLAFNGNGDIFIAQNGLPFILHFKYDSDSGDSIFLDQADSARAANPAKIYIDSQGRMFIIDKSDNSITIYNDKGKYIKKLDFKFKNPGGILVNSSGDILISDKGYDPIMIFSKDGSFNRRLTRPESTTDQYSFNASGLAIDQRGWIYTLDVSRNKLMSYDPTGITRTSWAPSESPFFPVDIAIDRNDNIYVLESGNGNIRVLSRGF